MTNLFLDSKKTPVGVIGVGLLGSAIVERLIQAGLDVLGYDINPESCSLPNRLGGQSATAADEVFDRCSMIILSLPNSDIVREVVAKSRNCLQKGQFICDTTTGDPDSTERVASELADSGVRYLDTTVVGSSEQLRRGEATLLIGGDPENTEFIRPLLEKLSSRIFMTGPVGSAAKMKLVVNLAIGLHRAVLAESLALASALKLDLTSSLQALIGSPAYSRMMDSKGEKMLRRDFTPQARLAQHRKDVQLMLSAARASEIQLPVSQVHLGLLDRLVDAGYGDQDNSSIILAYLGPEGE